MIIFTDWGPTARGNMDALRNVFDTNGNGRLDAGDRQARLRVGIRSAARLSSFRIVVTNADGTTIARTLAELGITRSPRFGCPPASAPTIDLTAVKTSSVLPDGSRITGQTTYTRTDGTTGTVADAALSYDHTGHAVTQTTATGGDGTKTVTTRQLRPDGSLAGETKTNTSADGMSSTTTIDHDGDRVVDAIHARLTATLGDGSRQETLWDYTAAGRLLARQITTTSADGTTTAITRDANGDGFTDQTEARATLAGGGTRYMQHPSFGRRRLATASAVRRSQRNPKPTLQSTSGRVVQPFSSTLRACSRCAGRAVSRRSNR